MLDPETREKLREVLRKLNIHIEDRQGAMAYLSPYKGDEGLTEMARAKVADALVAWLGAKRYLLEVFPELKSLAEAEEPVPPKKE